MQTCYSMNNLFQPNNSSRSQPDVPSGQRDRVEREAPEALNTPTNPEIPQKTSDKPSSPEATTNKDTPDENKKAFGTINVEQYIDAEMNIRFSIKNTDENTLYYLPKILMYTNFNDTVKRDECELDFTDHSSIAVQCINDKVSAIVNISPETYNQLRNTINFTSENKSMKEIGINKELTDLLYNCVTVSKQQLLNQKVDFKEKMREFIVKNMNDIISITKEKKKTFSLPILQKKKTVSLPNLQEKINFIKSDNNPKNNSKEELKLLEKYYQQITTGTILPLFASDKSLENINVKLKEAKGIIDERIKLGMDPNVSIDPDLKSLNPDQLSKIFSDISKINVNIVNKEEYQKVTDCSITRPNWFMSLFNNKTLNCTVKNKNTDCLDKGKLTDTKSINKTPFTIDNDKVKTIIEYMYNLYSKFIINKKIIDTVNINLMNYYKDYTIEDLDLIVNIVYCLKKYVQDYSITEQSEQKYKTNYIYSLFLMHIVSLSLYNNCNKSVTISNNNIVYYDQEAKYLIYSNENKDMSKFKYINPLLSISKSQNNITTDDCINTVDIFNDKNVNELEANNKHSYTKLTYQINNSIFNMGAFTELEFKEFNLNDRLKLIQSLFSNPDDNFKDQSIMKLVNIDKDAYKKLDNLFINPKSIKIESLSDLEDINMKFNKRKEPESPERIDTSNFKEPVVNSSFDDLTRNYQELPEPKEVKTQFEKLMNNFTFNEPEIKPFNINQELFIEPEIKQMETKDENETKIDLKEPRVNSVLNDNKFDTSMQEPRVKSIDNRLDTLKTPVVNNNDKISVKEPIVKTIEPELKSKVQITDEQFVKPEIELEDRPKFKPIVKIVEPESKSKVQTTSEQPVKQEVETENKQLEQPVKQEVETENKQVEQSVKQEVETEVIPENKQPVKQEVETEVIPESKQPVEQNAKPEEEQIVQPENKHKSVQPSKQTIKQEIKQPVKQPVKQKVSLSSKVKYTINRNPRSFYNLIKSAISKVKQHKK